MHTRGHRSRPISASRRPQRGVRQQRPAEPAAGAAHVDGQLLDVQAAVDLAAHQERDRLAGVAGYHPQQPGRPGVLEVRQRPRIVLRHLRHADVTEHLPGRHVDILQHRQLRRRSVPDDHAPLSRTPATQMPRHAPASVTRHPYRYGPELSPRRRR
jgi:hypothetical protein